MAIPTHQNYLKVSLEEGDPIIIQKCSYIFLMVIFGNFGYIVMDEPQNESLHYIMDCEIAWHIFIESMKISEFIHTD